MSTIIGWIFLYISFLNIISGHRHRHHQLFAKYTDPDKALENEEINDIKYAHNHRHRHNSHKHKKKLPHTHTWDVVNTLALARIESYKNYYKFDEETMEMEVIDHADIITRSNVGGRDIFRYHGGHIQIHWPQTGSQLPAPPGGADAFDAWKLFLWHDMAKKFNADVFDAAGRYAGMENRITGFRERCKDALLLETNGGGLALNNRLVCYDNMGSNNPTSDLDFTLVRWDEPQRIVTKVSLFYSQCQALLGNWPIEVFDMNFYIATCIVSKKPTLRGQSRDCHGDVHANVANNILTQIDNNANNDYELYGIIEEYHDDNGHAAMYKRFDEHLQLFLIRTRIHALAPLDPPDAINTLIKLAKVYYNEIYRLQQGQIALTMVGNTRISNDNLLYIKSLLLWMNYFSDESYVSNIALESIWMAQKGERHIAWSMPGVGAPNGGAGYQKPNFGAAPTRQKRYLLALDCFGFIAKYIKEANKLTFTGLVSPRDDVMIKRKKSLHFIDRISKYVERIGDFISPLVLDTNDNDFKRVGNGGIPNWEGGTDAHPTWDTAKVNGIDKADRKIFMRFYRLMRKWVARVRGKTPLVNILNQYDNRNAGGTAAQRGAKILHLVTEDTTTNGFGKLDTPDKINLMMKKIADGMLTYMESRVNKDNKKILENAMGHILGVVKLKIILTTDTINYDAHASTLAHTIESREQINLYAKATTTVSKSQKWDWS